MDGEGFFSRGRAGQGQKSVGQGRAGQGSESKVGAGWGTHCVYQLIEIICYSRGSLDLHCIKVKVAKYTQYS